jgi:hypothetical protein
MQEQKKILEWYKMLPSPYREQAIENASEKDSIDFEQPSLYDALLVGFGWLHTKYLGQGLEYWNEVADCALKGNFDGIHAKLNTPALIHSTEHNITIYAHKADA